MSPAAPRKTRFLAAFVILAVVGVAFAAVRVRGSKAEGDEAAAATDVVPVRVRLPLPPGTPLDTVSYLVRSAKNVVLAQGTVPVSDPAGFSQIISLPVAEGDVLTAMGHPKGKGADASLFVGSMTFDVDHGGAAEVGVSAAPAGGAAVANAGVGSGVVVGGSNAAAGSTDNLTACQRCQADSKAGVCDPPLVTATSNTNNATGEQTAIGWGCATLPTPAARTACSDLLHCLNANDCGEKGQNPIMACYCGRATAQECFSGQGLTGACVQQYLAAAAASPDGPPAGADTARASPFIATNASDPITVIGLADNIRHCAMDTPCEICEAL